MLKITCYSKQNLSMEAWTKFVKYYSDIAYLDSVKPFTTTRNQILVGCSWKAQFQFCGFHVSYLDCMFAWGSSHPDFLHLTSLGVCVGSVSLLYRLSLLVGPSGILLKEFCFLHKFPVYCT